MKASELRIGNLTEYFIKDNLDERKEWWEVNTLDINDISDIDRLGFELAGYRPIPITEECLLKFGFVIRNKHYSLNYGGESMRYAFFDIPRNKFILYFHGKFGFNCEEGRKNEDYCIVYVHQLQNLYFALTGTELTLNINNEKI